MTAPVFVPRAVGETGCFSSNHKGLNTTLRTVTDPGSSGHRLLAMLLDAIRQYG